MAESEVDTPRATVTGRVPASDSGLLDKILGNPLVGLSPWIIYSLVEGENRLEIGAGVAFGAALVILLVGWIRGSSPKLLEYSDVIYFAGLAIFVALASDSTHDWLELWGGEVANTALVVIVVGSMLIRQPFTLAYAKEQAPESLWSNPTFIRENYLLTGVWALAFIIEALSGLYGDAVLDNSNNIWTGWVVQTLPLIIAAQFTLWHPARTKALAAGTEAPPFSEFLGQITPWIAITGVIVLSVGGAPEWVAIALIAAGVLATKALHRLDPTAVAST